MDNLSFYLGNLISVDSRSQVACVENENFYPFSCAESS